MTADPTRRSEKNRRIAEALGYKLEVLSDGTEIIHELDCCNYLDCECEFKPIPDFYTDRAANAMVLEALLANGVTVTLNPFTTKAPIPGGTVADFFRDNELFYSSNYVHWREAICEAFLKWKEEK